MPGPKLSALVRLFCVLGLLLTSAWPQAGLAATANETASQQFQVNAPQLREMSGISASPSRANRYWAHNDSGDSSRLFAFDEQGRVLTELKIKGATAFDWEDMSSFRDRSGSYLLIADIGDNLSFRPFTDVYLLAEPQTLTSPQMELAISRHFLLVNEDGPRDAEAMAVDSRERFVYILTKRDIHPRLYRFSLDALTGQPIPLNYLGEVRSIPSEDKHQAQGAGRITRFSPTAMEFSLAGDAAIIVTSGKTYYFPRLKNQTWLHALNQTPTVVNVNRMPQIEAGTFSRDGKKLLIGSEGVPAKIEIIPRPKTK